MSSELKRPSLNGLFSYHGDKVFLNFKEAKIRVEAESKRGCLEAFNSAIEKLCGYKPTLSYVTSPKYPNWIGINDKNDDVINVILQKGAFELIKRRKAVEIDNK